MKGLRGEIMRDPACQRSRTGDGHSHRGRRVRERFVKEALLGQSVHGWTSLVEAGSRIHNPSMVL